MNAAILSKALSLISRSKGLNTHNLLHYEKGVLIHSFFYFIALFSFVNAEMNKNIVYIPLKFDS